MASVRNLLAKVPFFAELSEERLNALSVAMRIHEFERQQTLFHQGEPSTLAYIVISGQIRLVQHTLDGKDVTMGLFTAGGMIGVIMLLTGEPYPGTAQVLETSRVLSMPAPVVWGLLEQQSPFGMQLIRMLSHRLLEAHNRIRELSAERVQQRLARCLLRLVEKVGVDEQMNGIRLDIRLSRQDLAQMNGTTLETISRILSAWETEGIIVSHREQISVINYVALTRIADDLPLLA
jgi:CRP-like cAMP-binding protein